MPPNEQAAAQPAEQGIIGQIMSNLPKYIMIYMAINYFTQSFKPATMPVVQEPNQPFSHGNSKSANFISKYRFGEKFEFKFYISKINQLDESAKLLLSKQVVFGEYEPFEQEFKVDCDQELRNNGR